MAAKPCNQATCKPALVAGAAKQRQPPAAGFSSRAEICPGGVTVLASAAALPGAWPPSSCSFVRPLSVGVQKVLIYFKCASWKKKIPPA